MTQEFVTLPREVVTQALDALEGCRVEYDYHGNPVDASDQDVINARTVLRAALEQPQIQSGGIPPGWRLVPVEPTQAQLNAWQSHFGLIEGAYVAMLNAAPQPPAVKDSLTAQQPQGVRETAPNGATHIQPQQGAFYKRVDEKWYVWSRMEDGRPHRWYISPGTVESCLKPISAATERLQNHVPDAGNMVPAGWKLVPVEPNDDMDAAAETDYEKFNGGHFPNWKHAYRAMLAAAPQPPVVEQPQAEQLAMTPIAQRKLDSLLTEGYTISGYSVYHEQKHQHGFVTGAGLVGWWRPEGMEYPQPLGEQEPLFWYRPRGDGLYEGPLHKSQIERVREESGGWVPLYTNQQPKREPLTDEQINAIADAMPGGLEGFLKGWGWRQFARAVIEATHNIK